jgi:hypothetical protein
MHNRMIDLPSDIGIHNQPIYITMLFGSMITHVLLHDITLKMETTKTSSYAHNYNTC